MLHILRRTAITAMLICAISAAASAAKLSPALSSALSNAASNTGVGVVIVSFNTSSGLNASHLYTLRSVGISRGITLPQLGMVAVSATAGQVRALASNGSVRSIWSNDQLQYFLNQARVLCGVDKIRIDPGFTSRNGGLPVSGAGNFSVVINDSGIDGTHADLKYPTHVVQNVQIVTDTESLNQLPPTTDPLSGFTPLVTVENVPNTDTHIGHGTHCAGIVGGTGQDSGGLYAGVAPGAKLIGLGSGAGLFILNALGGFQWSIANQFLQNIRVISNSWGGGGAFDPDNPINIATKQCHDLNMIVCFAAGNEGPGPDTLNPYAKAPWVISVGAGTKEGGLANFSSRGTPARERLADNDPNNDFDAPTVVAPGTGREFDSDSSKFSFAIVSTRSTSNVVANGADADLEIPPAFLPFYTQISGTSMATPFCAGVVALMLDADPVLAPDDVKQILRQTASVMPGFEEWEVGSGYINAYAAVDKVFNRSKSYGAINNPTFNAQLTITPVLPFEHFGIDFSYIDDNANRYAFNVDPGIGILDVRVDFGTTIVTSQTGNVFFLILHAPDGTEFSSGPSLPLLTQSRLETVVKNPMAGGWVAEVSAGYLEGVVPATVPEHLDGIIKRSIVSLQNVPDIVGRSDQTQINTILSSRRMDIFADGGFHPDANVTREDFARTLALNTPLRQSLGATPKFADVSADLRPFAEAVTANGSNLRDWNFTPQGLISASGTSFNPTGTVNRLDLAVAFVRSLGLDTEARALANTAVTVGGQPLVDNAQIPGALRGYVQLAIDKAVMEAFPAEVREIAPGQFVALPGPRFEPSTLVTRAGLAIKLIGFAQRYASGN